MIIISRLQMASAGLSSEPSLRLRLRLRALSLLGLSVEPLPRSHLILLQCFAGCGHRFCARATFQEDQPRLIHSGPDRSRIVPGCPLLTSQSETEGYIICISLKYSIYLCIISFYYIYIQSVHVQRCQATTWALLLHLQRHLSHILALHTGARAGTFRPGPAMYRCVLRQPGNRCPLPS